MEITKLEGQLNDPKKPVPKTVILWGRADLLGEAIESILTMARNWQVIKIIDTPDWKALTRAVEEIHPEIVIIIQRACANGFPPPIHLMEAYPKLRVITINPDNNLLEVYNREEICIEEISDLLSILDKHPKFATQGGEKDPQTT